MQFKSHPPTGGFGDNAIVNFDIQDAATVIRELLDNEYVTIGPSVSSAFRDGAISAYGATPENLLQAKGTDSQCWQSKLQPTS